MKHLRGPSTLFAVCIGFAATCGVAHADDFPQVRYEVSGSAGVAQLINYQTDTGQQRAVNAQLPWSAEFTAFGGQVFVLSAQAPGTVTCRIILDGNTVKEATASGAPGRTVCTH
ncbi:MmpS family transport accessory protein [Mycobacterium sp.]|uniref:MmpS family transport accessory protein n=1 Tax=Mycobacterium sp. TaxID=1785 RepID=UPI002C3566CA|nr:MmpS family transport accessory protein [Mycobacterium sp.]HTQ21931.1 MmpS family transport accessory protein [Mycobacterium sp.]